MGSCSNYSRLEYYVLKNGKKDKEKFEKELLGKKVEDISKIEVYYHVKSNIILDDGSMYEVHYRWTCDEEDSEGKEMPEIAECMPIKEFFKKYIIGKEITKIKIDYERDDYVYCICYVGNPEDGYHFDIPIIEVDDIIVEEN